jgi:hypothetical protein
MKTPKEILASTIEALRHLALPTQEHAIALLLQAIGRRDYSNSNTPQLTAAAEQILGRTSLKRPEPKVTDDLKRGLELLEKAAETLPQAAMELVRQAKERLRPHQEHIRDVYAGLLVAERDLFSAAQEHQEELSVGLDGDFRSFAARFDPEIEGLVLFMDLRRKGADLSPQAFRGLLREELEKIQTLAQKATVIGRALVLADAGDFDGARAAFWAKFADSH